MESDVAQAIAAARRDRLGMTEPDLLPSRRAARSAIREAMARERGPVVLTGEPGSGKTALWRSLEAERDAGSSWLAIEATPGLAPRELYRLIAHGLGVKPDWSGRPELLDFLQARSLDDERWTLVVDEAQNLGPALLEELRVLSNRLGQPDGFAAILLVGQTALARWLAGDEGRALASRIVGRVHLRPLDADEVGRLLAAMAPRREWPEEVAEQVHRETRGRPALVVDFAFRSRLAIAPAIEPIEPLEQDRPAPLMGPARPPIRVEDGLIEVGWSAEPEPPSPAPAAEARPSGLGEQRVEDPYAALQAWREWATNQGRHPELVETVPAAEAVAVPGVATPPDPPGPRVWADEEHGFAPFGRLFGRLPQENETD